MINNTTDYTLIAFKSISNFVQQLSEIFVSDENHSLKLYQRLLNKTTLSHTKAIDKHIIAFREFCLSNRDAIYEKNFKNLIKPRVEYSSRVYIDFNIIFKEADSDTRNVIWKHLLTISAFVDPAGKAKEILKENKDNKEADFLTDIINKVESNVKPDSNPLEAVSSIMSSGIFNDLISGMNNKIENGELDLSKLMGTVQEMCVSLNGNVESSNKNSSNTEENKPVDIDPMNMITSLMGNLTSGKNDGQSMPDLSNITSLLGPMLAGLGGNNSNNSSVQNIEEIINNQVKEIKKNEHPVVVSKNKKRK
jgi:hypothetical protein